MKISLAPTFLPLEESVLKMHYISKIFVVLNKWYFEVQSSKSLQNFSKKSLLFLAKECGCYYKYCKR